MGVQAAMAIRLTRLVGAAALVLLVSAVAPIARVYACSCMQLGAGQALANADVAFVGVVVHVRDPAAANPFISSADPIQYTFAIEETLKGTGAAQVTLSSARDGASCGTTFALAQRWRVYAYADAAAGLASGLCSGNELLAEGVPLPAADPAPPPVGVLVAGGALLVVLVVSAWAFTRRGRAASA